MRGTRLASLVTRVGVALAMSFVSFALFGCGGEEESPALRVGLIPNQAPEEVEAQYEPLRAYLSEQLDREVELFVPTGYPAVVEAMASGELDLAHYGGLTYVQAREQTQVTPLVTDINPGSGNKTYRSAIIVPADSDVRNVRQLEGRDFAFGSVSSTSGSLYPSIILRAADIDFRTDLGEFTYTGGHDATAQAVANGSVDAGGIELRILRDLEEEGAVEEGAVRVLRESPPIEGYPWVARGDLPEEEKQAIRRTFVEMEDPELLDLLRAEGYARVVPSDYDYIEEQARDLDLLTETG